MNDNKNNNKDDFELEYLLESVKRYNIQEPPKESSDRLFNLLFTVIPVALVAWGLVSLQQCESDFKASEKNKMLQQDIKYRSCVNVRAIDRAAADPQTYHESVVKETKAAAAETKAAAAETKAAAAETKAEDSTPTMKWSNHNGDYMKCRKDFVKYLKYCQRHITNPAHDPMYVSAEIKGDVLCLISYSFKQLPSNRDRVWDEYEQMILDCNFKEVRMCPLVSTKFYLYWKDGAKYEYWK